MNTLKAAGLALAIALVPAASKALEVLNTEDTQLDVGGRFQMTGHLQHSNTNGPAKSATNVNTTVGLRDSTRIYLFQNQNRLEISGKVDGIKFNLVEALGSEGMNGSNNQINLLEMNALIPVVDGVTLMAGLFRVPTSRASALDDASLGFTEKSFVNNWFFNAGYDNGLALNFDFGAFDAILGTGLASPNIPVRYLPVIFQLPPPLYLRIGAGTLKEDPYHPSDLPEGKLETAKWAVHANGQYIKDSNAGHSSLLGQANGGITPISVQSYYGNAFLSSGWNPFIGLRTVANGPINQVYWNASVDGQYQAPLGEELTLSLSGQVNFSQFINNDFAALTYNHKKMTWAQLSATGVEVAALVMGEKWGLGVRGDVTLPDPYFAVKDTTNNIYMPITNSDPIYELTFPSIVYRHSKYVKVIAETQFWFNAPEALADSGTFQLLDEVTQVSLLNKNNPVIMNTNVVSNGRMMLQVDF